MSPNVFTRSILTAAASALAGLYFAAAILTWAEGPRYGASFFQYRVESLDLLPSWIAATLLLLAVNGVAIFRLANLEGRLQHSPRGAGLREWDAFIPINPLRVIAVNLVAIPAVLALFLIARANCW